jgi:hypothetical protein
VGSLSDKNELMGYILMKLVKPYSTDNYLIKNGCPVVKKPVISELGIYGVFIAYDQKLVSFI